MSDQETVALIMFLLDAGLTHRELRAYLNYAHGKEVS